MSINLHCNSSQNNSYPLVTPRLRYKASSTTKVTAGEIIDDKIPCWGNSLQRHPKLPVNPNMLGEPDKLSESLWSPYPYERVSEWEREWEREGDHYNA